jgi:Protein of unknown function (DUF4038)/Domain of unknown function (DUF5060)
LDVVFRGPEGHEQRVPAFWAGGKTWRIRYAPPRAGRYTYRTVSSDPSNPDLHGQTGALEVSAYTGDNPLIKHGGIRVAADRRHFQHEDGTPFFWMGDTWWMGLCQRLRWPADFQTLAQDRIRKGFSVVQIVAGLYPDMPPFDPRGQNEAGYPWETNYTRINPHYFDMADLRILYLTEQGLVPCVVGCWGYFMTFMGLEKIKKHWRNIIARWGGHPVIWCLAGEGTMPYYLSKDKAGDAALQRRAWTEIARYVREVDSYHRPITIHPSRSAMDTVDDPAALDFDMLQTGHGDRQSIPNTINTLTSDLKREPKMPVLVGECCYEGILDENHQEIERYMFLSCILSGAAGHTYGANGIWQVNRPGHPYGPSPHGRCWGNTPWEVACQLPGSGQIGHCKKMLVQYPWWRFEAHPEWVDPHWTREDFMLPFAAGIPGEVRVVFIPTMWNSPKLNSLETGTTYKAFFFNPRNGGQQTIGDVTGDASGSWEPPITPTFEQWLLILEKKK